MMKKNLLFAAALLAAGSASAQVEVGFLDAEALGLADKPTLGDNTKLVETENVTMYWLNEGEANAQSPDFNGFKQVIVNGETVTLVKGIGGATNPSAVDINSNPAQGGVQYHFEVKKDGWLIVPSKISSNKNFYAYEGSFAGEMSLMGYTLGMDLQSADYPEISSIIYTLPADEFGYFDMASADAEKYTLGGTAIAWPIRIATQNADAASGGNGTGVMMFPVFAEAVDYYCFATGSKMNTCGFIFVPGEAKPDVTLFAPERTTDDGVVPAKGIAVSGELQDSGVNDIISDAVLNENAPIYNVLGQPVSKDYKGIQIQNGKKFYNR